LAPGFLTLKNSTWWSHCIHMFCRDLRTNTDFCITQMQSVYCAIYTESLYKAHKVHFQRVTFFSYEFWHIKPKST